MCSSLTLAMAVKLKSRRTARVVVATQCVIQPEKSQVLKFLFTSSRAIGAAAAAKRICERERTLRTAPAATSLSHWWDVSMNLYSIASRAKKRERRSLCQTQGCSR